MLIVKTRTKPSTRYAKENDREKRERRRERERKIEGERERKVAKFLYTREKQIFWQISNR